MLGHELSCGLGKTSQRLPGLADVKKLKSWKGEGQRVGHVNEKEHLVELGEPLYWQERVWRGGPAPEIPVIFLDTQFCVYMLKLF